MREISFYRTVSGRCPVEEFLDSLTSRQSTKVTWTLRLIEELEFIPKQYFKKLVNTDDIWEVRVRVGRDTLRFFPFLMVQSWWFLITPFQNKRKRFRGLTFVWRNRENGIILGGKNNE